MRFELLALALFVAQIGPAAAIYKCETPGRAPVYQDEPCPTGAISTAIESDSEREARQQAAEKAAAKGAADKAKAAEGQKAAEDQIKRNPRIEQGVKELGRLSEVVTGACHWAEMSCSHIANSLGLLLDIVGVLLLWKFGLPESISREGHNYLVLEQYDEAEIPEAARYDRWAKLGLGLIVAGFAFQLASNFMSS